MKSYPVPIKTAREATLFPAVKNSQNETRATSIFLSVMKIVPAFAASVVSDAGGSINSQSKLNVWTEVELLDSPDSTITKKGHRGKSSKSGSLRPDGFIEIEFRKKKWTALLEAKVDGSPLEQEQVLSYLDLAKRNNIDCVITISNQLSIDPTHSPAIDSSKIPKDVGLFHISWLSILTKASLLADKSKVTDTEQKLIMKDLMAYIKDPESKLNRDLTLSSNWKKTVESIRNQVHLNEYSPEAEDTIEDWLELKRFLALKLSAEISEDIEIKIPRKFKADPHLFSLEQQKKLANEKILDAQFDIPNAAGTINVIANFSTRAVLISLDIDMPKDKKPKAAVMWLMRELRSVKHDGIILKGSSPRRNFTMDLNIGVVDQDPTQLLHDQNLNLSSVEIVRPIKMQSSTFTTQSKLPALIASELISFYRDIGQHLNKYTPPTPKAKVTPIPENTQPEMISPLETDIAYQSVDTTPNNNSQTIHDSTQSINNENNDDTDN